MDAAQSRLRCRRLTPIGRCGPPALGSPVAQQSTASDTAPMGSASRASIVAILHGRMTEGAGRPLSRYPAPGGPSSGRGRFSALVSITTQGNSAASPTPLEYMTSAGRR